MAACLLENSWSALGLFGGRSPLFSFLVFSISTSLIFSRPNAKGRCPPSFSLPEIVAHVSQKRPRTMDFISIAVCDLLYLVLQQTATFTYDSYRILFIFIFWTKLFKLLIIVYNIARAIILKEDIIIITWLFNSNQLFFYYYLI